MRSYRKGWGPVPPEVVLLFCLLLASYGCGSNVTVDPPTIVVTSPEDTVQPPAGKTTLRAAMNDIPSGGRIVFDNSLNGVTIDLRIVGSDTSLLKGEIYSGMTFQGFGERNYGKSALYAAKDLTIDAFALPDGITLRWVGGDHNPARVLAVYGNLTMRNVRIFSGFSSAEQISGGTQPYTLARGGGIAVWGTARLENCTVSGNRCLGDNNSSRDRGTYGGGIFTNGLFLDNCVISGNSVFGYGAAGGGIHSVGGADRPGGRGNDTSLSRCTVSGNRVTAQHAYGGGIFTLSGGPNNLATMSLTNCTVARNLVEDNPALPESGQYYYRGGGIYMGGGSLSVNSCTIVENEVRGHQAVFGGKPNMGGGGIAATIGNAHVVENMEVRHSIVSGNTLSVIGESGVAGDLFSGSLLHFYSYGHNRVGALDFRQILVPIPPWWSLSRKHWPKTGDIDNVAAADVLDLPGVVRHGSILSIGTDPGQFAVLWYPPRGTSLDQVPVAGYSIDDIVLAQYGTLPGKKDDFLPYVLNRLSADYGAILGPGFGSDYRAMFESANGVSLDDVVWYGTTSGWPSDPGNALWIDFWRGLDNAIAARLGAVGLGDDFWGSLHTGLQPDNVVIRFDFIGRVILPTGSDQLGNPRPNGPHGDIGA